MAASGGWLRGRFNSLLFMVMHPVEIKRGVWSWKCVHEGNVSAVSGVGDLFEWVFGVGRDQLADA